MPNPHSSPSNQYLFLFRSREDQPDPSPEEMQRIFGLWMDWMKSIKAQGRLVAANPLADGGRVLRQPRGASVTDGPYIEAKESIGGYLIVTADNLDQATEMARGCPGLANGNVVEVRPIENLPSL